MTGTRDARERVLNAATSLFYENGITATGVDVISEHAGVGKMSLYRHFTSKDDLVVAVLKSQDQFHLDFLLPETTDQGPRQQVAAMFDRIAHAATGGGFNGCPFLRAGLELPTDHPGRRVVREHKARFRARLRTLMEALGVADAAALAWQLATLADGAAVESVVQNSGTPARAARTLAMLAIDSATQQPDP
ncbi:TetR/AcrR family transcriptional regulator [Streptomyces sp. NPDC048172]|uniref:TetR/AcrR family transcriptional regulator n=1 Tax=Streptomyces sp. NPDC048172 TaxID=3365505 RepID=UPI00371A913B